MVINKIDLVEPAKLREVRAKVETIVPRARILETQFGAIPIDLLFDHEDSLAAAALRKTNAAPSHGHRHGHSGDFASWSYRCDDKAFSFRALQRIVEHLPKGIYRAKGMVRLDLASDDYGILQVTGRRGWLRLTPKEEHGEVATEIVFIGRPDSTCAEKLREHVETSWRKANDPSTTGYAVTDLRAFSVEFV